MTRQLLRTKAFIRASKRFLKQNPNIENAIRETLTLLSEDAFHPRLKTHKLKGVLSGSWACSVGFDLRIIFSLSIMMDLKQFY